MSMLNALLAEGAVDLHGRASDWREAIELAGGLLVAAGKTSPAYTEAMVRSVEENGPYIVVHRALPLLMRGRRRQCAKRRCLGSAWIDQWSLAPRPMTR